MGFWLLNYILLRLLYGLWLKPPPSAPFFVYTNHDYTPSYHVISELSPF